MGAPTKRRPTPPKRSKFTGPLSIPSPPDATEDNTVPHLERSVSPEGLKMLVERIKENGSPPPIQGPDSEEVTVISSAHPSYEINEEGGTGPLFKPGEGRGETGKYLAHPNQLMESSETLLSFCAEEALFLDASKSTTNQDDTGAREVGPNDDDGNFYGMGQDVKRAVFESFAVTQLHYWQKNMLREHLLGSKGAKNGLILAPTSGGKTLASVTALLHKMLVQQQDVVLALPYVALVEEKVRELKKLATRLESFTVAEYAGTKGRFPLAKQSSYLRTLYVATNEKANAIWRFLCKENSRREEIGLVVIDEVHMMSDGVRGTIIEEFIVSLIHWSGGQMSILALSATIGNPKTVQAFLGGGNAEMCDLFEVARRLMKLQENMVVAGLAVPLCRDEETGKGTVTYSGDVGTLLDCDTGIDDEAGIFNNFDDGIMFKLIMETVERGGSVLVFCSTRIMCPTLCKTLTAAINYLQRQKDSTKEEPSNTELYHIQRQYVRGHLREESKGHVDRILLEGISVGVAYHSAALHATERKAVEDGFAKGIISVLFCTTTLAAGVNLPADRVLIRSAWTGSSFLRCSSYLQMVGRAGRTNVRHKKDIKGSGDGQELQPDSYIFIQPKDVERFQMLIDQHVEDVYSQLLFQPSYYSRRDNRPIHEPAKTEEFTGVTRIVFNALEVAGNSIPLKDIIAMFQLTLLYQAGDKSTPIHERTVKPLFEEITSLQK